MKASTTVISRILDDLEDLEHLRTLSLSDIGRQARRLRVLIEGLGIELNPAELNPKYKDKWS